MSNKKPSQNILTKSSSGPLLVNSVPLYNQTDSKSDEYRITDSNARIQQTPIFIQSGNKRNSDESSNLKRSSSALISGQTKMQPTALLSRQQGSTQTLESSRVQPIPPPKKGSHRQGSELTFDDLGTSKEGSTPWVVEITDATAPSITSSTTTSKPKNDKGTSNASSMKSVIPISSRQRIDSSLTRETNVSERYDRKLSLPSEKDKKKRETPKVSTSASRPTSTQVLLTPRITSSSVPVFSIKDIDNRKSNSKRDFNAKTKTTSKLQSSGHDIELRDNFKQSSVYSPNRSYLKPPKITKSLSSIESRDKSDRSSRYNCIHDSNNNRGLSLAHKQSERSSRVDSGKTYHYNSTVTGAWNQYSRRRSSLNDERRMSWYETGKDNSDQRWLKTRAKRHSSPGFDDLSTSTCYSCRLSHFPLSNFSTEASSPSQSPRIIGRLDASKASKNRYPSVTQRSSNHGVKNSTRSSRTGAHEGKSAKKNQTKKDQENSTSGKPLMVTRALSAITAIEDHNKVKVTPDELAVLYFRPVKNRNNFIQVDKSSIDRLLGTMKPKHFVPKQYRENGHVIDSNFIEKKPKKKDKSQVKARGVITSSRECDDTILQAPGWWLGMYGYTQEGQEETRRRTQSKTTSSDRNSRGYSKDYGQESAETSSKIKSILGGTKTPGVDDVGNTMSVHA